MKRIELFLIIPLLMAAVIGFNSCSDDDNAVCVPSVTSLTFDSETFSKTFDIEANVSWTLVSDQTWCTVNHASGSGNQEITVTVTENEDVFNPRPAVLTLTPVGLTPININVNQLAGNSKSPVVKDTVINVAADWGTWNYFSFAEGKIIGKGAANADIDTEWKERTDWDIAFTRLYARTNGGASGDGEGGVMEIQPAETDKAKIFKELSVAPTGEYVLDEIKDDLMISMGGPSGPTYYSGGSSEIINSWLSIAMPVTASPKVLVIKTADGKYVKLHLKGYQNEGGASGYISMEYAYQADGSTNLATDN